jgi:hypothetical protein
MPNTTKKNPDADFSGAQSTNFNTGKLQRPSKTQGFSFGGQFFPSLVNEQIPHRFKKKRLGGRRAAARSRSALTIPFDAEKPLPKF